MPETHQPEGALEGCSLFVLERYPQELGVRRVGATVAFDGRAPLKKLDDAQQALAELFLQERVVEDDRWLAGCKRPSARKIFKRTPPSRSRSKC